jgi:hypothetical protein
MAARELSPAVTLFPVEEFHSQAIEMLWKVIVGKELSK